MHLVATRPVVPKWPRRWPKERKEDILRALFPQKCWERGTKKLIRRGFLCAALGVGGTSWPERGRKLPRVPLAV